MKFINSRVIYSLLFYIMAVLLVIVARPDVMFAPNGDIKTFGVGLEKDGSAKTIFSFGVFAIVLAIVSFYMFAVIDIIFK